MQNSAGVLPLQGVGCPVPRDTNAVIILIGAWRGDAPGAVPGEAHHRHQELRARALPGAAPGLKLQ